MVKKLLNKFRHTEEKKYFVAIKKFWDKLCNYGKLSPIYIMLYSKNESLEISTANIYQAFLSVPSIIWVPYFHSFSQ